MNVRELGEFGLIDRIAGQILPGSGVVVGIGDDAAVTSLSEGCLTLTTSDMLLEGVHFDLSLCDPRTLGRKALSVNLSDIAAMGGKPRYFLLSLGIPSHISLEFIDAFTSGLLERAAHFGATLIGGDTCSSRGGLVISITLMGEQLPEKVIRRGGARPGDLVFVTGTLGDSALGLELLRRGEQGGPAIARHLDPLPRVEEGVALAEAQLPTAMIDVSDGLLADLGHILDCSSTGARLDLEALPLSGFFRENCPLPADDSLSLALSGGEDYELLFTVPAAREDEVHKLFSRFATPVTKLGEITSTKGIFVIAGDGNEFKVQKRGYNHFA